MCLRAKRARVLHRVSLIRSNRGKIFLKKSYVPHKYTTHLLVINANLVTLSGPNISRTWHRRTYEIGSVWRTLWWSLHGNRPTEYIVQVLTHDKMYLRNTARLKRRTKYRVVGEKWKFLKTNKIKKKIRFL